MLHFWRRCPPPISPYFHEAADSVTFSTLLFLVADQRGVGKFSRKRNANRGSHIFFLLLTFVYFRSFSRITPWCSTNTNPRAVLVYDPVEAILLSHGGEGEGRGGRGTHWSVFQLGVSHKRPLCVFAQPQGSPVANRDELTAVVKASQHRSKQKGKKNEVFQQRRTGVASAKRRVDKRTHCAKYTYALKQNNNTKITMRAPFRATSSDRGQCWKAYSGAGGGGGD